MNEKKIVLLMKQMTAELSEYKKSEMVDGSTIESVDKTIQQEIMSRYSPLIQDAESELTYRELRAQEYPSIQDQLDMQYWDKVNGTNVWGETINAIKLKYPKT